MKKKRRSYNFLIWILYITAVLLMLAVFLGKAEQFMLFISVFCIALGGTLSGAQFNREFTEQTEERRRKNAEKRQERRKRRI
ncbi:MAG: hypothetical protein ACI4KH_04030 [Oscillospiraceae bacterium]